MAVKHNTIKSRDVNIKEEEACLIEASLANHSDQTIGRLELALSSGDLVRKHHEAFAVGTVNAGAY